MNDKLGKMDHVFPKATEQLVLLREQASRYGMIHESQTTQLKMWPRILIANSTKSVTAVDTEKFEIEVRVTTKGKAPKDHKKKVSFLADAIHWLLGDTWEVRIVENGGKPTVFKRLRSATDNKYAGTDFAAGMVVPDKPWDFRGK